MIIFDSLRIYRLLIKFNETDIFVDNKKFFLKD